MRSGGFFLSLGGGTGIVRAMSRRALLVDRPARLLLVALAASADLAPAAAATPPASPAWVAMLDAQHQSEVEVRHSGSIRGTFKRNRGGLELINEGPDHAVDIEAYAYGNAMGGALAADPERAYGDTRDILVSGFVQTALADGDRLQFIGAIEFAAEDGVDLGDGLRWGAGAAHRWKRRDGWDVALGAMIQDRFEMSPLPIPYLRAIWDASPSVRVEFRGTGLQNGVFSRWFVTEDRATSLDLSVAYETLSFRLANSPAGPRAVAIGEVPIRLGITQFLEPSGTWFARVAVAHNPFHRQSFRRDGDTVAVFQADGSTTLTLRLGARF